MTIVQWLLALVLLPAVCMADCTPQTQTFPNPTTISVAKSTPYIYSTSYGSCIKVQVNNFGAAITDYGATWTSSFSISTTLSTATSTTTITTLSTSSTKCFNVASSLIDIAAYSNVTVTITCLNLVDNCPLIWGGTVQCTQTIPTTLPPTALPPTTKSPTSTSAPTTSTTTPTSTPTTPTTPTPSAPSGSTCSILTSSSSETGSFPAGFSVPTYFSSYIRPDCVKLSVTGLGIASTDGSTFTVYARPNASTPLYFGAYSVTTPTTCFQPGDFTLQTNTYVFMVKCNNPTSNCPLKYQGTVTCTEFPGYAATTNPPTTSSGYSSGFSVWLTTAPLTIHWSGAPPGMSPYVSGTLVYATTGESVSFTGTVDTPSGSQVLDSSVEAQLPEGNYYITVRYSMNGVTQTIQTNAVTVTHPSSSSNKGIIIGTAVGGAVALIVLIATTVICVRRRRSRRVSVISMDPSAAKGMAHLPSSTLPPIAVPAHYQKQQDVETGKPIPV